jgi:hypothetical protein
MITNSDKKTLNENDTSSQKILSSSQSSVALMESTTPPSPDEFITNLQSSSSLDDYTKNTFQDLMELLHKAKDTEMTMVAPTTDKMKILWNGFQTTVQNNCNLRDMILELTQTGWQAAKQQLQFKQSPQLDMVDFIPSGVLDERTKEILRDLSKLGEKISSQFANSTVHFQHPFLINLALLRLYVMQSEDVASLLPTAPQASSSAPSCPPSTSPEISEHFLSKAKYYLKYAADVYDDAIYISSEDILLNELYEQNLVGWTNVKIPRHIVFLDHLTRSIVVSIRGTASIGDILTDLHLDSIPFDILPKADPTFHNDEATSRYQQLKTAFQKAKEAIFILGKQDSNSEGSSPPPLPSSSPPPDPRTTLYAHNGMAQSAHSLLPGVKAAINRGLNRQNGKYQNYEIVITGHSLGAGTACLLSLLLSTQHNFPVTTYAFAPPPVLNTFPIPSSVTSKCQIHSFINHRDVIPRASHSEILNMLSVLNAIDSMSWKAVDRMMLLMRGYLTNEEKRFMKESIDKTNKNRVNYHGENDEINMIVPGNIYLLKPKQGESLEHPQQQSPVPMAEGRGSPLGKSRQSPEGVESSGDRVKELKKMTTRRAVAAAAAGGTPYQLLPISSVDSMALYNGFFYTGDSMVSDHLVSSYLASMINLQTNTRNE